MDKALVVLGSTGSIGTQTLEVADRLGYTIKALTTNQNIELIYEQAMKFKPKCIVISDKKAYKKALSMYFFGDIDVLYGQESLVRVVHLDCDLVVNALVGFVGLRSTYEAIKLKKDVALANKESLVIFGKQLMNKAKKNNVRIIPIDSEHCAIFQCLENKDKNDVENIVLTASGGPFRSLNEKEFKNINIEDALKHPNWSMGNKITIDSATMMNKGLELIEAVHLFNISPDRIKIVVHPQSVVHSMVEFVDGSVLAQLSEPDMRLPIQYALTYPKRVKFANRKIWYDNKTLTFEKPRLDVFGCLKLAYYAAKEQKSYPCVMNAANEVLVSAFLQKKIPFLDIERINKIVLDEHKPIELSSIEDVYEIDKKTRIITQNYINGGNK